MFKKPNTVPTPDELYDLDRLLYNMKRRNNQIRMIVSVLRGYNAGVLDRRCKNSEKIHID